MPIYTATNYSMHTQKDKNRNLSECTLNVCMDVDTVICNAHIVHLYSHKHDVEDTYAYSSSNCVCVYVCNAETTLVETFAL